MATYNFVVDGSYVNISGVANTHARLHNSSQAIEWFYDGSGDLVFSIDDVPYLVKDMSEVIIDGVTLTDPSEFETNIKLIFPGYAGGGAGFPAGTKMYTALLSQSGTDAPVATVLMNTLGGTVVWARTGVGVYTATLAGAFTENKTFLPNVSILSDGGIPTGSIVVSRFSPNIIKLESFNNAGDPEEIGIYLLNPFSIQIIVFP
jgi:hypothetical protein